MTQLNVDLLCVSRKGDILAKCAWMWALPLTAVRLSKPRIPLYRPSLRWICTSKSIRYNLLYYVICYSFSVRLSSRWSKMNSRIWLAPYRQHHKYHRGYYYYYITYEAASNTVIDDVDAMMYDYNDIQRGDWCCNKITRNRSREWMLLTNRKITQVFVVSSKF